MKKPALASALFCFAISLVTAYFCLIVKMHFDMVAYFNFASRIVEGKKLYIDIIDANFPSFYYWRVPVIIFSKFVNLSILELNTIYDILWMYVVVYLSYNLLDELIQDKRKLFYLICLISVVIFLLPFKYSTHAFGQKAHYFVAFFLPYLLWMISKYYFDNRKQILSLQFLLSYLLALFAVAIKPNFILAFLFLEFVRLIHKRTFIISLESFLLGLGYIIHFALFYFLFTEYFENLEYISLYRYFNAGYEAAFGFYMKNALLLFVPILLLLFTNYRRVSFYFLIFLLGLYLINLSQLNTSSDKMLLPFSYLMLFVGFIIIQGKSNVTYYKNIFGKTSKFIFEFFCGIMATYIAIIILINIFTSNKANEFNRDKFVNIIEKYQADSVYSFSEHFLLDNFNFHHYPKYSFFYNENGVDWNYRNIHLWMYLGIHNRAIEKGKDEFYYNARNYIFDIVYDDMVSRPDIIFVDYLIHHKRRDKAYIDFVEIFKQDKRIANILSEYEMVETITSNSGHEKYFDIYLHRSKKLENE